MWALLWDLRTALDVWAHPICEGDSPRASVLRGIERLKRAVTGLHEAEQRAQLQLQAALDGRRPCVDATNTGDDEPEDNEAVEAMLARAATEGKRVRVRHCFGEFEGIVTRALGDGCWQVGRTHLHNSDIDSAEIIEAEVQS